MEPPPTCAWPAVDVLPARVIGPARLNGGLVNQLHELSALVMRANRSGLGLVLPTFDSHLAGHSMGVSAQKPTAQPFGELFRDDCFAAAMRAHGLVVWPHAPASAIIVKPPSSRVLFANYNAYLHGRWPIVNRSSPLDAAVYRALHPSWATLILGLGTVLSRSWAGHAHGIRLIGTTAC